MTTTATPTEDMPTTDVIDAVRLRQMLIEDPDIRILDVRTGGEFESGHIPGSYNVPLDTLGEHVRDLADVERSVVLVCQSGGRATQAHSRLSAAGKDTLHILEGGMVAWNAAGGDVAHGETDRWAMDRQVRFTAGLTYSAVSNTCAMAAVLAKLPYNQTDRCDIARVLSELNKDPS
ncbi:MAG: rhodanese-related sulfurtransferase [Candidatus Poriferisodalaceae bacterium]|jgi:rhodanese-related sulfurtransferase